MTFTTQLWSALGLNRDSLTLFWLKWAALITALAPMGMDVTKYGIPATWVPYIQLAALFISVSAAQHRTSDLPGGESSKPQAPSAVGALLAVALLHPLAVGLHQFGHELKYEPPKILHLLGIHRGHLKADGRKV